MNASKGGAQGEIKNIIYCNYILSYAEFLKGPLETIYMKCHSNFSGENKKKISTLPSAEFAQRVVKVTIRYQF